MKTLTTPKTVLIGSFVGLVMVGTLPTFTPTVFRGGRHEVANNAGASVQTADNAGGPIQTA